METSEALATKEPRIASRGVCVGGGVCGVLSPQWLPNDFFFTTNESSRRQVTDLFEQGVVRVVVVFNFPVLGVVAAYGVQVALVNDNAVSAARCWFRLRLRI